MEWNDLFVHSFASPIDKNEPNMPKHGTNNNNEGKIANDDTDNNIQDSKNIQANLLHVYQSPLEFLVSKHPTIAEDKTVYSGDMAIRMWRNERQDTYYSTAFDIGKIPAYSSLTSAFSLGCAAALKLRVYTFLWNVMDKRDWGIWQLHRYFTNYTEESMPVAIKDCSRKYSKRHLLQEQTQLYVHLPKFLQGMKRLGFPVDKVLKQQWYHFYAEIRALNVPTTIKHWHIAAFKTFLIDPMHSTFWNNLAHEIVDGVAEDSNEALSSLVHIYFPIEKLEESDHKVPYELFKEQLGTFLSKFASTSNQVSPSHTICRLLHRFDTSSKGGTIGLEEFQIELVAGLRMARDQKKLVNKSFVQCPKSKLAITPLVRPNVEAFTTSGAMKKLYSSRAKNKYQVKEEITDTADTEQKSLMKNNPLQLKRLGNCKLARMRRLPVSRLLREGVSFRPQHSEQEMDDLNAISAREESF